MATPKSLKLFSSIGRLHIVAIAALGNFTFGWLFTGHYAFGLAAICALDWFLVNLLNRVVDLPEDRKNAIVGTDFVSMHRRTIIVLGFATLFVSLLAVQLVYPVILPLRIAYHLLGFAYNWPLFPGGRRIKQLYFWKNCASATGFMITVFGYPLFAFGAFDDRGVGISAATIAFSGVFFFLFELSYEVIYDLRDAPGDAIATVRTYPVVHGERGAIKIIDGLIAGSMLALVVGYATGALPWRIFIMICAPAIQLVVYKRWLKRGITAQDCINLTWLGALLLTIYHLWVIAKLPGVA